MGRPPIGEKAMSSSERAQRHRNNKRLRAQAPRAERAWLINAVVLRLTALEKVAGECRAAHLDGHLSDADAKELVKRWDFIAELFSEPMRDVRALVSSG
jgi:hypothetical protein